MVKYIGYVYYEHYINKQILMYISKEKTLPTCYNFIKELKILYGSRYVIYIDGAVEG